jgi:uncharacterized membrane protein YqhA
MLGVMMVPENSAWTLAVVIVSFVLAMALIIQLIAQEVKKADKKMEAMREKKIAGWGVLFSIALIIVSFPLNAVWVDAFPASTTNTIQPHHH